MLILTCSKEITKELFIDFREVRSVDSGAAEGIKDGIDSARGLKPLLLIHFKDINFKTLEMFIKMELVNKLLFIQIRNVISYKNTVP